MSALLLSSDHNDYLPSTWDSGNNRALDLLHTMTECVNNSRKSGINRYVEHLSCGDACSFFKTVWKNFLVSNKRNVPYTIYSL
jgi:hypothetical protein